MRKTWRLQRGPETLILVRRADLRKDEGRTLEYFSLISHLDRWLADPLTRKVILDMYFSIGGNAAIGANRLGRKELARFVKPQLEKAFQRGDFVAFLIASPRSTGRASPRSNIPGASPTLAPPLTNVQRKPTPAAERKTTPTPDPTIQVRWSKAKVTPNHNSGWPPAKAPRDTVPDEAKVSPLVETTNVPDGTTASISIHHCHTGALVKNGTLRNLVVKGNKVVDPKTGKLPEWTFEAEHLLWDPWDKPFYFFKATVNYRGLSAETPKDYNKKETETLRVFYWHVCVSDAIADTPAGGKLTTGKEMAEVADIIGGQTNHKIYQQAFNQYNVPGSLWGSVLRNTYSYHHASHGDIIDRTTGVQLNTIQNPPEDAIGNWRSVIVLGNTVFGDVEVKGTSNVPSVPRYLAYMDTCVAGWEPSLGKAFITRGTRFYLAFRMYIPDRDARQMARDFYKKWCTTFKSNPDKIPDVFFDIGSSYYGSMRPILMGAGGGDIESPIQRALNAIEQSIRGVASSIASFFN